MINNWTDNWEQFYSTQWLPDLIQVEKVHGKDPELQAFGEEFCEKVIARLLRPLQTGGRTISRHCATETCGMLIKVVKIAVSDTIFCPHILY